MKTIIAGGRDYQLTQGDYDKLAKLRHMITEVVSGGCRGVDQAGERWAKQQWLTVRIFKPDWESKGNQAEPMRNTKMAKYAEALIAFPGGKGTNDMVEKAKAQGLRIFDMRTP